MTKNSKFDFIEEPKLTRKFFDGFFLLLSTTIIVFLVFMPDWLQARGDDLVEVNDLRCEYVPRLQGLDHQSPSFGWVLESKQRGQKQTAYQIVVSNSEGNLMWDSGKVESSESSHVKYAGKQLKSSSDYYWKVKVWNKDTSDNRY